MDGKWFNLSGVDFHFIAANAGQKLIKSKFNPERALVRFEFMEVLVRIAEDRFLKNPDENCKDIVEACERLINNLEIYCD